MPEADDVGPEEAGPDEPEQLAIMREMLELAHEQVRQSEVRSEMSAERSEMSSHRSYMNAERTLSVWIRTALAAMVVGIAVDRFGLSTQERASGLGPDSASTWVGAALCAFGVLIAAATGVRFRLYASAYLRTHAHPEHHGPFLATGIALFACVFGIALVVLLLATP
jgi:putative membrane protein